MLIVLYVGGEACLEFLGLAVWLCIEVVADVFV